MQKYNSKFKSDLGLCDYKFNLEILAITNKLC
jgi:hypothetical protein